MNLAPIIIAILLASNAAVGWAWLQARDRVAELDVLHQAAVGAADQCSRSVVDLQDQAKAQAAKARPAIAAAAKTAQAHDTRADQILVAQPSVAGNDCASAQARIDEWLANRAAKP